MSAGVVALLALGLIAGMASFLFAVVAGQLLEESDLRNFARSHNVAVGFGLLAFGIFVWAALL